MTKIEITVDGELVSDDVEPRMLLVQYLREKLGKTGTVIGCDTSNCGACTVHLDGQDVARLHARAVEVDRARAAVAGVAADDRAGLPELLPEVLHQQHPGFDVVGHLLTVDSEADPGHVSPWARRSV